MKSKRKLPERRRFVQLWIGCDPMTPIELVDLSSCNAMRYYSERADTSTLANAARQYRLISNARPHPSESPSPSVARELPLCISRPPWLTGSIIGAHVHVASRFSCRLTLACLPSRAPSMFVPDKHRRLSLLLIGL